MFCIIYQHINAHLGRQISQISLLNFLKILLLHSIVGAGVQGLIV